MIRIVRELEELYRDVIPAQNIYALPKKKYRTRVYVFGIKVWDNTFNGDMNSVNTLKDSKSKSTAGF